MTNCSVKAELSEIKIGEVNTTILSNQSGFLVCGWKIVDGKEVSAPDGRVSLRIQHQVDSRVPTCFVNSKFLEVKLVLLQIGYILLGSAYESETKGSICTSLSLAICQNRKWIELFYELQMPRNDVALKQLKECSIWDYVHAIRFSCGIMKVPEKVLSFSLLRNGWVFRAKCGIFWYPYHYVSSLYEMSS